MNKTRLIIIVLAVVAAGVLAFTWRSIPILNDMILASGLPTLASDLKTQVLGLVSDNPLPTLGALAGVGTFSLTALKKYGGQIQQLTSEKAQLIRDGQNQIGDLAVKFSDAQTQLKSMLQANEGLEEKITGLEVKLVEQAETYANIDNVLQAKDDAIKKLRDQTDGLHEVIKNMKLDGGKIVEKTVVL